jgi:hypothetical protein
VIYLIEQSSHDVPFYTFSDTKSLRSIPRAGECCKIYFPHFRNYLGNRLSKFGPKIRRTFNFSWPIGLSNWKCGPRLGWGCTTQISHPRLERSERERHNNWWPIRIQIIGRTSLPSLFTNCENDCENEERVHCGARD